MLAFFRRLMPQDELFIEQFCRHSTHVLASVKALRAMMSDESRLAEYCAQIAALEKQADEVTRDTLQAIHRSFITPFDRAQIFDLTTALDDTIDLVDEAARRIPLYRVAFTPEMRGMADCAVAAVGEIHQVLPLLSRINRSVDLLTRATREVSRLEAQADDLLERGLEKLFRERISPGEKLTVEKVYDLIESVVDRCDDIGDVIDGIVIEQV